MADSRPDEVAETLGKKIGLVFAPEDTAGAWKFRWRDWENENFKRPYHRGLLPDNTHGGSKETPVKTGVEHGERFNADAPGARAGAEQNNGHADPIPPKVGRAEQKNITAPTQVECDSLVTEKSRRESPIELTQPQREAVKYGTQQEGTSATGLAQVESGIKGMSIEEKAQVEDFLRDQYSSRKK